MKVGDLVMDDRSHIDESNWFWNAWRRRGVIIKVDGIHANVVWSHEGKTWEQCVKLSNWSASMKVGDLVKYGKWLGVVTFIDPEEIGAMRS